MLCFWSFLCHNKTELLVRWFSMAVLQYSFGLKLALVWHTDQIGLLFPMSPPATWEILLVTEKSPSVLYLASHEFSRHLLHFSNGEDAISDCNGVLPVLFKAPHPGCNRLRGSSSPMVIPRCLRPLHQLSHKQRERHCFDLTVIPVWQDNCHQVLCLAVDLHIWILLLMPHFGLFLSGQIPWSHAPGLT